jgi:nucleotide-binding universal stress UspA family protein
MQIMLARVNGASLQGLHVVDTAAVGMIADRRKMNFERQAAIAAEGAKEVLVRWLAQAGAPASCQSTIVVGAPLHEILEQVKTPKPDLVVAGITGAGESKAGTGSLAHRLARKVPTKALLERANHSNQFRKIIACINFSETSCEVATQAHRIAIQDGGSVDAVLAETKKCLADLIILGSHHHSPIYDLLVGSFTSDFLNTLIARCWWSQATRMHRSSGDRSWV